MTETSTASDKISLVSLASQDGTTFELPLDAALQSKLVKDSLNLDDDDDEHDTSDNVPDKQQRQGDEEYHVDLKRVPTESLASIVEFMKHYQTEKMDDIAFPLKGDSFEDCVDQEWYRGFIDGLSVSKKDTPKLLASEDSKQRDASKLPSDESKNQSEQQQQQQQQRPDELRDELFSLLHAANYMDIQPLIDLIVLRVTFEVIGKNVQEMSSYFKLPMPTDEDIAFAREHHPWILEGGNDSSDDNNTAVSSST